MEVKRELKINYVSCCNCRKRKIKCILSSPDGPCKKCSKIGVLCVFEKRGKRGPNKVKKPRSKANAFKSDSITELIQITEDSTNVSKELFDDSDIVAAAPAASPTASMTPCDSLTTNFPTHIAVSDFVATNSTPTVITTNGNDTIKTLSPLDVEHSTYTTPNNSSNSVTTPTSVDYSTESPSSRINSQGSDCSKNASKAQQYYLLPPDNLPYTNDSGLLFLDPVEEGRSQIDYSDQTQYNYHFISSLPSWMKPLSTDLLCSRPIINSIIKTYLEDLYPLTPIVHRPTFISDLNKRREKEDPLFLGLILAVSAFTVAHIPRKLASYKVLDSNFRYQTCSEMICHCHDLVYTIKSSPYWISSYNASVTQVSILMLISMADYYLTRHRTRAFLLNQEAFGLMRLLGFGKWPEGYRNISKIEAELRKRTFWIQYFHTCIINLRETKLSFDWDNGFGVKDFKSLYPTMVDDEFIFENRIEQQCDEYPTILEGFIVCINLHTLFEVSDDTEEFQKHISQLNTREVKTIQIINKMRNFSKSIPRYFCTWKDDQSYDSIFNVPEMSKQNYYWYSIDSHTLQKQVFVQRANIGVTQFWMQSILLESIENQRALRANDFSEGYYETLKELTEFEFWKEKEKICRNLFKSMASVTFDNIESNSFPLIIKLRMIAGSLVKNTKSHQASILQRAEDYLKKLSSMLLQIEDGREDSIEAHWRNEFSLFYSNF